MPLFKDLSPLDDVGLQDHRPEREVKWSTLTNVIFKDGGIQKRPGIINIPSYSAGPLRDIDMPATAKRGTPLAIMEITNPGSSTTGREGFKWITERELPDSNTELVAGWTNDYTEIDDDPPNGTDCMWSKTDGAQEIITFSDTSSDFDSISHLIFRGRAKTYGRAMPQTLNIYYRSGTTNYLIASIVIYPFEDGEGAV